MLAYTMHSKSAFIQCIAKCSRWMRSVFVFVFLVGKRRAPDRHSSRALALCSTRVENDRTTPVQLNATLFRRCAKNIINGCGNLSRVRANERTNANTKKYIHFCNFAMRLFPGVHGAVLLTERNHAITILNNLKTTYL